MRFMHRTYFSIKIDKFICLVFTLLFFVFGIYAQNKEIKVACVGNSITFGAGINDPIRDSYPSILGRMLGNGYDVRNFGRSGATLLLKGNSPYWKTIEYQNAKVFNPDIVVIK